MRHHESAERLGARCEDCPLGRETGLGPVPSEVRPSSRLTIVVSHPTDGKRESEVREGRLMSGKTGSEILSRLGARRSDASIIPAISCAVPGGVPYPVWAAKAKARGAKVLPAECCAPRMRSEYESCGRSHVLALGAEAFGAVVGTEGLSVGKRETGADRRAVAAFGVQRGHPYDLGGGRWLHATYHLGSTHVSGMRHFAQVVRDDLEAARRIMREGAPRWTRPWYHVDPSVDDIVAFCHDAAHLRARLMIDIETDGVTDAAKLRCVGLGYDVGGNRRIMVVPWRRVSGERVWGAKDAQRVVAALRTVLASCDVVGHNSAQFDVKLLVKWGLIADPGFVCDDTLLMHKNTREVDCPHSLAFVMSRCTDAPLHKVDVDHKASDVRGEDADRALWTYNGDDIATQMVCDEWLQGCLDRDGTRLQYETDRALAPLVRQMSDLGMCLDLRRVSSAHEKLLGALEVMLRKMRAITGAEFNPNSPKQVAKLLFRDWGLLPAVDARGKPADREETCTNAAALIELEASLDAQLPRRQAGEPERRERVLLNTLIVYRSHEQLRKIYTAAWPDLAERVAGWPEHLRLIRSTFAPLAASGRLTSKEPNLQNVPTRGAVNLRRCFRAAPGHVLISCDFEQLEVRIFAIRTQDQGLLRSFREGLDAHSLLAAELFRDPGEDVMEVYRRICALPSKEKKSKRSVAKSVRFGENYGMDHPTLYRTMRSARDKATGVLEFPWITPDMAEQWHERFHAAAPNVREFIAAQSDQARTAGFVSELGGGRRRWFPDWANKANEPPNHPIQGEAAHITNTSFTRIAQAIPFRSWSEHTGIVCQVHDDIIVQVPTSRALEALEIVRDAMWYDNYAGSGVPIYGEPEAALLWSGDAIRLEDLARCH